MRRPDWLDLALLIAAAALSGVLTHARTLADWLFVTVVLALAAQVIRAMVQAELGAREQRRAAVRLARTEPGQAARRAIVEERRRLNLEISTLLRHIMMRVEAITSAPLGEDPRVALRSIHELAQLATTELRRQLGLLRAEDAVMPVEALAKDRRTFPVPDLVFAGAVTVLAAVETQVWLHAEQQTELLPWAVGFTALAAATVVGRTRAPGLSAALCGAVMVLASLVGYPVSGGFWCFATLGALLWVIAARGRPGVVDVGGAVLLVIAVVWTRVTDDPDNLFIFVVVLVVAIAGGLVVRLARSREGRAASVAALRRSEIEAATAEAVTAERIGFARDLHDVMSHAVGLIAMQAAAGEVSWPEHPERVQQAVATIRSTAQATLSDLGRLLPEAGTGRRSLGDLHELVARIRAAGTSVDLTVVGEPSTDQLAVIYRVVQEALTNAVRHAPGAAVSVDVHSGCEGTSIRVADDGPPPVADTVRGYGLVGLSERVEFSGGTLRAGHVANTGFVVAVTLPVKREAMAP